MTKTKKPFKRISKETIQQVQDVSILDLAEAMGHGPTRHGKQYAIYCPNPNHGAERTPDTYIEPYKNIFKCFGGGGCGCGGNNSITYYSWSENGGYEVKKDFVASVKGVAAIMGMPIQYDDGSLEQATTEPKKRTHKVFRPQETEPKSDAECDRVYRAFLALCPVRPQHLEDWKKRGYTNEEIKLFGLRSVPNQEELASILQQLHQQGIDLKYVPGFAQKASKSGNDLIWSWSINAKDGYFIPVRNELGQWYRMRIRRDEGKPKYIWFSSFDNSLDTSCEYYLLRKYGASSGAPLNITAPTQIVKNWQIGDSIQNYFSTETIITTEGEHKSQLSAKALNTVIDGVPGVGNFRDVLPMLKRLGTKKHIIAYDMDGLTKVDSIDGKNQQVFDHIIDFAKQSQQAGVSTYLWTWNANDGKGLDDLILGRKLPIEVNLTTKKRRPVTLETIHQIW